jgi:hypothetical protein
MIDNTAEGWHGAEFRKSSYSGGANNGCVELAWRKSSHSGGDNNGCVELAWPAGALFGVRDSKNVTGPVITFEATTGHRFVAAVADDQFPR